MMQSDCTILRNSFLTASINHKGAELTSLRNSNNIEYIWEGNPEFWGKHSPVLFPVVGTLKNNSYTAHNKSYQLLRHGFAREMEFNLIEKSSDTATFSLSYNVGTLATFPFKFELQISYRLHSSTLEIEYQVLNHDQIEMPFSIGAHPAFALPGEFENYSLEFEENETLKYHLLENDLVSNNTGSLKLDEKRLRLDYSLFKKDALIFKNLQSKSITIIENSKPLLKINFGDFPHLGIWTKLNAPFLCIEPWFGYSDTTTSDGHIFEKEGIQILKAGAKFTAKFTIEIFQ